jgi:hypothetical protein
MNEVKKTKDPQEAKKRAWTSPKLISFGDVRKVTKQTKTPEIFEDDDPLVLWEFITS